MSASHEELVAKQAITEALYRYCRAMDRLDAELGYSVWHGDGTADYGILFQGSGSGFVDWVCQRHSAMSGHSHQVSNVLILVDGERAGSEAYVTTALRNVDESGTTVQRTIRGRYVDRWSRRNGIWAIDHRQYLHDFDDVTEIGTGGRETSGRRDRTDPSYELLA